MDTSKSNERFRNPSTLIFHRFASGFAELLPRVVRRVRIVDVEPRSLPVLCDHLVQQRCLLGVDQHMLPQSALPGCRFLPHVLVATGLGADPATPVEPFETLDDRFDALPFAAAHGKFDDGTNWRLLQWSRGWAGNRIQNAGLLGGDREGCP